MKKEQYDNEPRDLALEMVEEGLASADHLLLCALKYMSCDDVRGMLDVNELSPRFTDPEEDEDEENPDHLDEDEAIEDFWENNPDYALDRERMTGGQNSLRCDVRCAFVQHIDDLQKSDRISDETAQDITLSH